MNTHTGKRQGSGHFELFAHDADMGVRGIGATVAEAFEQAALGLTAIITDPGQVLPGEAVAVQCEAPDLELLLVDWLNALVFEMATRRMLFGRFQVDLDGVALKARAWGEPVDQKRHQPCVEVKGATYTELAVYRRYDELWITQCVVDV